MLASFKKWFEKIMTPRMNRGETIHRSDCRIAWNAAWKACSEKYGVEEVCKVIEDSMFTIEEAVKVLKAVRMLINASGLSKEEFKDRFVLKVQAEEKG